MMGAITPQPASPQEHRYTATLRPTPSGASSGDVGPRMSSGSKPPHPGAACSNRSSPSTRIRTTGQSGVSRPSTRRVRTDTGSLCDETFLIVGRFAVRQNHRLASLVASGYLQCKDPAHEVTLKGTHGRGRSADRIPTRTPRNRSATISHQPEVEHACLDFVIAVTLVALSPPSAALDATGTSPSATKRRQMQREHVPDKSGLALTAGCWWEGRCSARIQTRCIPHGEAHRVFGEVSDELPLLGILRPGHRAQKPPSLDLDMPDDRDALALVEHVPDARLWRSLQLRHRSPVLHHLVTIRRGADTHSKAPTRGLSWPHGLGRISSSSGRPNAHSQTGAP